MIYGIGVDLVDIKRIERVIRRFGERFEKRILAPDERRPKTPEDLAKHFSAKEAFVKALGTGFVGVGFKDIKVMKDRRGKPYIALSERIEKRFGRLNVHLSLSDESDYVIAMVVIEKV